MAIARVTFAKAEPVQTPINSASTDAFAATAGNLIVVIVRGEGVNNATITSVTDTAGNAYAIAEAIATQNPRLHLYYAKNIQAHAANQVAVAWDGIGETFAWIAAIQYSGLDTTNPLGATDAELGTGVTDLVSGVISTTQADTVLVLAASQPALTTYTAGADFTLIDGAIGSSNGDNFGGVEEYLTSSVLTNYTAHITSGSTANYTLVVAVFKGPPPADPRTDGRLIFRNANAS